MNTRLLGLDALRGIAAIMVVMFHLGLPMMGSHLAVDFFFMLSGFVMARTYDERLQTGAMSPLAFMIKRYRRLWGWMAVGTSVGFLTLFLQYGLSPQLLVSFALMVSLLPALNMPTAPYFLNIPLWSIVYELIANAAHAVGFARLGRKGLGVLALACFAGLCWGTVNHGFPRGGFVEYHWWGLVKVGASYTLGVLIWRLWGDTPPIKVPFVVALAALPLYALFVFIVGFGLTPLFFVAVIAPLMMFGGMGARIEKDSHAKLASALGDLSFPLYAVHLPMIMLLKEPMGPLFAAMIGLGIWGWLRRDAVRGALVSRGVLSPR